MWHVNGLFSKVAASQKVVALLVFTKISNGWLQISRKKRKNT